jgi:hypothetical protein
MATNITLTGVTGKPYGYGLCHINGTWNPIPGNYVFLDRRNVPIYVGETVNFSNRRPGPAHEKWQEAIRHGAVAVAAHANHGGEQARKAEETDLIRAYSPPCNVQHRPPAANGLLAETLLSGRKI